MNATPGPWNIRRDVHPTLADHTGFAVVAPGCVICRCHVEAAEPVAIREANARLIAAAPGLLRACEIAKLALRATSAAEKDYSRELGLLNAAIAKAKGA